MLTDRVKAWFLLCRPWSLTATAVPFFFFFSFFYAVHGPLWSNDNFARLTIAFFAAVSLQIACNLLNTWGDNRSGVDAVPGAVVTTPQIRQGLATSRQVGYAALGCLALTGVLGLFLCVNGFGTFHLNGSLLIVSVLGFLGATNYATGLKFKYRGLGVPFVFFLMGPIYFCGIFSCLVAGNGMPFGLDIPTILCLTLVSLPIACLVAAILHGNDMRDMPTDRAAGITTTATALRPLGALLLYWFLHLVPYAVVAVVFVMQAREMWSSPIFLIGLLPFFALPLTIRTLGTATRTYRLNPSSPPWMRLERASGGVHLVFGVLYTLAIAIFVECTFQPLVSSCARCTARFLTRFFS